MKHKNDTAICWSCGFYSSELTLNGMCLQCQYDYEIDNGEREPDYDENDPDYDPRLAM